MKLSPYRGIFGLPPATYVSDDMVLNSMPIIEIEPGIPKFEEGLNLFSINPAFTEYSKLLTNHGFEIDTNTPIKAACIADNFPTDTFTNDYGETFLQKFTDVASQGLSQITQMTGQTTLKGATTAMGNFAKQMGASIEKGGAETLGSVIGGAGEAAYTASNMYEKMRSNLQQGGFAQSTLDTLDKMMGGQRVDFPMIWRNSSYTPSYSTTIRLYNPNPGSLASTNEYIVGPLAVFLCLALPISDNGTTYNYPFFHRIKVSGLYRLDPAVITNITVIKGGDQQQVGFTKQLGMVDIRLDFTALYTTMVAEEKESGAAFRPTLKKYLAAMNERDTSNFKKRSDIVNTQRVYVALTDEPILIAGTQQETNSLKLQQDQLYAKNQATQKRQAPLGKNVTDESRVSAELKLREENLLS